MRAEQVLHYRVPTARLMVAARLREGQELLARVEVLEREVGLLLGARPSRRS